MDLTTICLILTIFLLLLVLFSKSSESFAYTNEMRTARRYYKAFQRNIRNADTKIKFSVFVAKCKESLEDLNKLLPVKLKDVDPEFVTIIQNMVKLQKEIVSSLDDMYNNFDKMLPDVKEEKINQFKEKHQIFVDQADTILVKADSTTENFKWAPPALCNVFGNCKGI